MEKSVVADNMRAIIESKGFKHIAVAERAGYTKQQFSDMLNGRRLITADDCIKFRSVVGCTYNDLFRRPEEQNN